MLEAIYNNFTSLVASGDTYLFLIPIYSAILLGERLTHHFIFPSQKWNNGDTAANLVITVAGLVINMLAGHLLPLAAMGLIYSQWSVVQLPEHALGWIAGFLLYDLAWYTDHRIAHRVGFFWAMHHVHHSSPEYNTTVASRGFLLDLTLLSRPTFYLLPLFGITPYHFMVISIFTNVWGIAQHTRVVGKLGFLDLLLATPSNHRVHHGSDIAYIDKNFGEVLMLWDHIFGTYEPETHEPTYGVTDPIKTNDPIKIQGAGISWLAAKMDHADGTLNKLRCLIMPPEWMPRTALRASQDQLGQSSSPTH